MNIFVLDRDPSRAAEYHCDKHVVKMVLEAAQLLSDVHRFYDPGTTLSIYRPLASHRRHPCAVWARTNGANYAWLLSLAVALGTEFELRYEKKHKSQELVEGPLRILPKMLTLDTLRTPFVQAMPDEYKCKDVVLAYRRYYAFEKMRFAKWERGGRTAPIWLADALKGSGSWNN